MQILSKTEVEYRVKKVIASSLCLEENTIQGHHYLWEDLLADHLDLYLLISQLEEEFNEHQLIMMDDIIRQSATVASVIEDVHVLLDTTRNEI